MKAVVTKKNRVKIPSSFVIDKKIADKLTKFAVKHNTTKVRVVEMALDDMFSKKNVKLNIN